MNEINKRYSVLRAVFKITPNITFVKNTDFIYIAASEQFAKMVGKECASEIVGKTDFDIFEESLAKKHRMEDEWILFNRNNMENIVEEYCDSNGNIRYDSVSKYHLVDECQEPLGIYGVQFDVTKDVLEQRQYEQEVQYLFDMNENVYFAYLLDIDEWKIIYEKDSVVKDVEMHFDREIESFCKIALEGVCSVESEAYEFYKLFSSEHLKSIYFSGQTDIALEYQRRLKKDEVRWVKDQMKFLKNPETGHLLLAFTVSDIEEDKQREQELIRRAETDSLTGVLNRATFLKKVQHILRTEGYGSNHALFMLDIDNFKSLNDTKGHQVGDQFLIEMSKTVKSCFRNTDIVGRLGGDEFMVCMRYTPSYSITERNAKSLLTGIQQLCEHYDTPNLSVSIGISVYPENGTTFDELYEKADKALYCAKTKGKNRFEFASVPKLK